MPVQISVECQVCYSTFTGTKDEITQTLQFEKIYHTPVKDIVYFSCPLCLRRQEL